MGPAWRILVAGADLTGRFAAYLVSLAVSDQAGIESDELRLEIADPRGEIAWPRHGALIQIALGYRDPGPVDFGTYTVDEVELANPPRRWTLRARAVALGEGPLKVRRTQSWESTTLGEVIQALAGQNNLQARITPRLAARPVARLDQTNESTLALLTRLGQQHDAIATVKTGWLLFTARGSGETVTGLPMPGLTLTPEEVSEWRVSLAQRERHDAVEARYYDRGAAAESWVRAGDSEGSSVYRLRRTYTDLADAQAAAEAKLKALRRGSAQLSLSLPGRVELLAETPITLSGFGDGPDGRWIVTRAEHRLDGGGYRVSLDAEREELEID